jgi:hypothetical protein
MKNEEKLSHELIKENGFIEHINEDEGYWEFDEVRLFYYYQNNSYIFQGGKMELKTWGDLIHAYKDKTGRDFVAKIKADFVPRKKEVLYIIPSEKALNGWLKALEEEKEIITDKSLIDHGFTIYQEDGKDYYKYEKYEVYKNPNGEGYFLKSSEEIHIYLYTLFASMYNSKI